MKKIYTKIILLLTLLIIPVLFFPNLVKAQSPAPSPTEAPSQPGTWYDPNFQEWSVKVYDSTNPQEIFGERYTAAQVKWIVFSLMHFVSTGGDKNITDFFQCIMTKGQDTSCGSLLAQSNDTQPSLAKTTNYGSVLSVFTSNPVSGISYISSLLTKLNIIPEAKAQGYGFTTAAKPIISLWRITRNFSFGFVVLAIIILSFMIMFRVKLNPQTVVTIQSVLPKVFIALILITFSYAIAGLLIDFMYVVIGLITLLLSSSGIFVKTISWQELYKTFMNWSAYTVAANYIQNFILTLLMYFPILIGLGVGALILTSIFRGWAILFFGILILILIVIVIINSFKIIIMVLKNTALVLLTIITGPFEILLGLVNQGFGFGQWLKKLVSYLALYPFVILIFVLAFFFLEQGMPNWIKPTIGSFSATQYSQLLFNPQLILGSWNAPLARLGQWDENFIWLILSFVLISLVPKAMEVIQGLLQGKPFDYGVALGETLQSFNKGAGLVWGLTGGPIMKGVGEVSSNIRGASILGTAGRSWLKKIPAVMRRIGPMQAELEEKGKRQTATNKPPDRSGS